MLARALAAWPNEGPNAQADAPDNPSVPRSFPAQGGGTFVPQRFVVHPRNGPLCAVVDISDANPTATQEFWPQLELPMALPKPLKPMKNDETMNEEFFFEE